MKTTKEFPLLLSAAVLLSQSASTGGTPPQAGGRQVDFSSYQKVPESRNSRFLRALLMAIRYTKERAFYGRYGGSGNMGGRPIDAVDALCRKHDIVYATAQAVPSLRLADQVFVTELLELDPQTLPPKARDFRGRAIAFMSRNTARFLGKPPVTWFRNSEPGLTGPVDERKLTRFFHVSAGPQETRLLVSMIGKTSAAAPSPGPRLAAHPVRQQKSAAFVAKSHSKLRGKP